MNQTLIILTLCHLIGDFFLQSDEMVKAKKLKWLTAPDFYFHVGIHFTLVLLFTQDWKMAASIALSHAFIDAAKLFLEKKYSHKNWFFYDQICHAIVLIILSQTSTILIANIINNTHIITGVLFLTSPASIIIKNVLQPWSSGIKTNSDDSLLNAGNYIGILERIFVLTFILTNHWEGVGFLLAAKSIFRFGDLTESKERKLTEYILIGTLLSFGLAMVIGLCIK